MNDGPKVLLGVCGSISAVATPGILDWLRTVVGVDDADVVVTASARRLVRESSLARATRGRVLWDWEPVEVSSAATHVQLARRADLAVVLPATANFLAKAAHGIADDLLTTTLLAVTCPVIAFPVMNEVMWTKPAVQRNVRALRADGVDVVAPQAGLSLTGNRPEVGSVGDFRRVLVTAITALCAEPGTTPTPPQEAGHR